MSWQIELNYRHQEIITRSLALSLEEKITHVVKDPRKHDMVRDQYFDAVNKLFDPITIHRSDNNLFTWIIDQLRHSPRTLKTELASHAIVICNSCCLNEYDLLNSHTSELLEHVEVRPNLIEFT